MPSVGLSSLGPPVVALSAVGVAFFIVPPIYKNLFPEDIVEEPTLFFHSSPNSDYRHNEKNWIDQLFSEISPMDIFINIVLISVAFCFFVFEKLQSKILDARVKKLKSCLNRSEEKLIEFREQKNNLETTLKMVQNATNEYNLLLFLLLDREVYNSKSNSEHNQTRESDQQSGDRFFTLQV